VCRPTAQQHETTLEVLAMTRTALALLVAAMPLFTPLSASADTLATWNFADNDGVVDTSLPGVTTTTFTGTGGLTITSFEARGGSSATNVTSAPYWQVSVSNSPFGLSLESIIFGARVYQQGGLRNGFVDVRSSQDGFLAALAPTPSAVTSESLSTITVPLGFLIQPGDLFTARFYLLDNPSDQAPLLQARLALDNVQINGTIPEPSTLALAAMVGMGFLLGAVRRRRAR
jgi:hypothetical protein